MLRPDLVTLDLAAAELGVPKGSLRVAAERLGLLVRMGRAIRIDRNSFGELVKGCQGKPQEPASTNGGKQESTTFETPAAQTDQPARETAQMLKRRSRPTSPAKESSPAPVIPIGSR